MRALVGCLFVSMISAQMPAPEPSPEWLLSLQKLQQEMHQVPIGSLDSKAELAWQAALRTPRHPQFPMAAQMTAGLYQHQGYDLKAEQILRRALAVTPPGDLQTQRIMKSQLAGLFENTQQLVKALAIREELAKEPRQLESNEYIPAGYEARALAGLYERMGEMEKAEAAWKEVAALQTAESTRQATGIQTAAMAMMLRGGFGHAGGGESPLAAFYARRGRLAEAEQLYREALADPSQTNPGHPWNGAADSYIAFLSRQSRFAEAADLARQNIARIEGSPDAGVTRALFYRRQQLASLLVQAGRLDEALAIQKAAAEEAHTRGAGSPEYVQALGALSQTLIRQKLLEEAEQAVAQMREAVPGDAENARFHESMAVQTLAQIREMQGNHEEALQLRTSLGVPHVAPSDRAATLHDLVGAAHQAASLDDMDTAVAKAGLAVALAGERIRTHPQEVMGLASLVQMLMGKQREGDARRIAIEMLRILEQVPDHPRVADVLGSIPWPLAQLGMIAEAERVIERMERILIGAKGADSLALNVVSHARLELMQRNSSGFGAIEERKRILARTEEATGPKSRESLDALRGLAWAYASLNNWPDEQAILSALLGRTLNLSGASSTDYAHLLQHMANRASQNQQFDQALIWMDQAIEATRSLPDAGVHLPGMIQNRAQIALAKDPPVEGPLSAPSASPANGAVRWFHTDRYQRTDGVRLGDAPVGAIRISRPGTAPEAPANEPRAVPAQAPPAEPGKP